jgi:hypothetical protein
MQNGEIRTYRPGAHRMSKARKSAYERLAETKRKAQQAENEVAALTAQIRDQERRKDTRRKVLGGGMAFAHARLDPAWRDAYANMLHTVGAAMKTERSRSEAAELEKYVRAGCPDVDIDQRIEEMQRTKDGAASQPVKPSPAPPTKPRGAPPPG